MFKYKSNGKRIGDGTRITRVETQADGSQTFEIMTDQEFGTFSEVEWEQPVVQPDPVVNPDPQPVPDPTPTPVPAQPSGTVGSVSAGADLATVISNLQPNDVVTLSDGIYGPVDIATNPVVQATGAVVRGSRQAKVKGMRLGGIWGVTFEGFHVAESPFAKIIHDTATCRDLTFRNVEVSSVFDVSGFRNWDAATIEQIFAGKNAVDGSSHNLTFENGYVHHTAGGITLRNGGLVKANLIEWQNRDAMRAVGSDSWFVGNTVSYMLKTSAAHGDMFQAGFNNPAYSIYVLDNTLAVNPTGEALWGGVLMQAQGIYFDDQQLTTVEVTGNYVQSGNKQGIAFLGGRVSGLILSGNELVHDPYHAPHTETMFNIGAGTQVTEMRGNKGDKIFVGLPNNTGLTQSQIMAANQFGAFVSR